MFDPFTHDEQKETSQLMWKSGKRELVFKGPIFDICTVQRTSNDGRCSTFIEVDCQKWVTIVPWFRNADGVPMFVMVDQFRHGSATVTREFPAGVVEKGEDPMDAGLRELKEETGLEGERVTALGNVSPNSAFMNNRSYFYLVEDVKHTSGQELDPNEQLDVYAVPVADVLRDLGTGIYDNGIMCIALFFFLREAGKRPELMQ